MSRHARRRAKLRNYTDHIKLQIGCMECGYRDAPEALQFDHIDPDNKAANVGQLVSEGRSIEAIQEEINKCRVLCANCHAIHTKRQIKIDDMEQLTLAV